MQYCLPILYKSNLSNLRMSIGYKEPLVVIETIVLSEAVEPQFKYHHQWQSTNDKARSGEPCLNT